MNEPNRRTARDTPAAGDDSPVRFADWARHTVAHLSEVSNSNPSAHLLQHNLVAVTDDLEVARVVALDFERVTGEDTATTTLVLGHPEQREAKHEVDPEGVTTHAAKRSLAGGIPAAIVAAIVVGLGAWLLTDNVAAAVAAAIGGAIFGFYVAAVWSYVIGTGQSRAYQQSFVDPDAADAVLVAFHTDDQALFDEARRAVGHDDRLRLHHVDARGRVTA